MLCTMCAGYASLALLVSVTLAHWHDASVQRSSNELVCRVAGHGSILVLLLAIVACVLMQPVAAAYLGNTHRNMECDLVMKNYTRRGSAWKCWKVSRVMYFCRRSNPDRKHELYQLRPNQCSVTKWTD